jgi:hypothetical protein
MTPGVTARQDTDFIKKLSTEGWIKKNSAMCDGACQ